MDKLDKKPTLLRALAPRGLPGDSQVIREGGDNGAGVIKLVSVITRGEALGHGFWVDKKFLRETATAVNDAGSKGVKARFTHPSLSGDGMGKFLGRVNRARVIGDQTYGDLHFSPSSHDTPDGDLASYVMDLAEQDPDAFGTSIAFMIDEQAEEEEAKDRRKRDPKNTENLRQIRLAELRAVDVVDEPAANPGGLFHRGEAIVEEADAVMAYALGLEDDRPELINLELDADRVADYIRRFLAHRKLEIIPKRQLDQTIEEAELKVRILKAKKQLETE